MANTRNASYCELLRVSNEKLKDVNINLCQFAKNENFLPSVNVNFRDCVADEHLCKYAMSELIFRDCETDEHQRKYEMSE